jgi:hypothetical protein
LEGSEPEPREQGKHDHALKRWPDPWHHLSERHDERRGDNERLAARMDRVVRLHNGVLE